MDEDLPAEVSNTSCGYICGQERNVVQAAEAEGGYDLIFECSGFSPLAFDDISPDAPVELDQLAINR